MKDKVLDHSLPNCLHKELRREVCVCLVAAALLLSLALGSFAALDYLLPKVGGRDAGVTTRLSWYVHDGQSQADVRTLAAVFRFITETDSNPKAGIVQNYSTLPLAENTKSNSPTS